MLEVWVQNRWVAYPADQVPALILADRLDLGAPARRPGAVHAEPLVDHLDPGQLGHILERLLGGKCLCQASERTLRQLRRLTEPASPAVWRGVSPRVYQDVLWCRAVLKDIAGEVWDAIATYTAFLSLAGGNLKDKRVRVALNNRAALAVRRGVLAYVADLARLVLGTGCRAAALNLEQIRHVARANGWLDLLEAELVQGTHFMSQMADDEQSAARPVQEGDGGQEVEPAGVGEGVSGAASFPWQRVRKAVDDACRHGLEDGCFLLLELSEVCPYPADVWSRTSCLNAFATALLRAVWDALGAGRSGIARALVNALNDLPAEQLSTLLQDERHRLGKILESVEAAHLRARFFRDLGNFEPRLRKAAAADSAFEFVGAERDLRVAVANLSDTAEELGLPIDNALERVAGDLGSGAAESDVADRAGAQQMDALSPEAEGAEWAMAYLELSPEERGRHAHTVVKEVARELVSVLRHTKRLSVRDLEVLARLTKIVPEWSGQVAARWFSSKVASPPDFHRIVMEGEVQQEIGGLGDVLADLPEDLATPSILQSLTALILGRLEVLAQLGFRREEVVAWVDQMLERQSTTFERWHWGRGSELLPVLDEYLEQLSSLCKPLPEPPALGRLRQLVGFLQQFVEVDEFIRDGQADRALRQLRTLAEHAPPMRSVYSHLLQGFCLCLAANTGATADWRSAEYWARDKLSSMSDEDLKSLSAAELEELAHGFVKDAAE